MPRRNRSTRNRWAALRNTTERPTRNAMPLGLANLGVCEHDGCEMHTDPGARWCHIHYRPRR